MYKELVLNELCIRNDDWTRLSSYLLESAKRWLIQFSQLLSLLAKRKNSSELESTDRFQIYLLG